MILGIDFGSKLAGTTVVAFEENGCLRFLASQKKQDADEMIHSLARELSPSLIAIDAPLSLPGVYTGLSGCDNHFYRHCDMQTKAMSPMFLGGLTARAMKLSQQVGELGTTVIEVYPVNTGRDLRLDEYGYRTKKADLTGMLERLLAQMELTCLDPAPITAHHIDALLAYHTGRKYQRGDATATGLAAEGLIYT